jgi:hypothetical protein
MCERGHSHPLAIAMSALLGRPNPAPQIDQQREPARTPTLGVQFRLTRMY